MDFSIPEEAQALKRDFIQFGQETIAPSSAERDRTEVFDRKMWSACAEAGVFQLAATKPYGGRHEQIDLLEALIAIEGLGYGSRDAGFLLALNAQMWTVQVPLQDFGTEEQKRKFLTKAVSGEWIGVHALTEPETGSDAYSLQMAATPVEGGYRLNGTKHLITLGPVSDFALVFASTNPKLGKWGISAFLVEKGTPGYQQSPTRSKMGLRTVPIGELTFTDCFVPEGNRLGKEGVGFSICNHSLEYDRCCMLAGNLGAMEYQLEQSIDVVKNRKQFGQPIGKFQSVSNRIAEMKLRLETSRLLLYKVAWLKTQNKNALLETAMVKLQLGESYVESSLDAIRNLGGRGYLSEYGIERDLRDSVGGILYAGTSDIQRNIIAQLLGL